MRVTVVIRSEEIRHSAGVRIRFHRISQHLAKQGVTLNITSIQDLSTARKHKDDIYIFSKCHEANAIVLARRLRQQGCIVGIDVCDDYFSQRQDCRFVHLRRWLRDISGTLDFILCSTPLISQQLTQLIPDLPCHILNDPFDHFKTDKLTRTLKEKAARARSSRIFDIGWFGMGDNPYFSVGLEDLHAFSQELARARAFGFTPHLRILTNQRALTSDRIELLARLPVPATLEEWSEAREAELISQSLACFLPVNAQNFSTVKSLNRAVTTLTNGGQVLSSGFPLYDPLSDFVYRDIADLLHDLEADHLKLRGDSLSDLKRLMSDLSDPETEACSLTAFLQTLPTPAPTDTEKPIAVLHGLHPSGNLHKAVRKLGALSVAAPQTKRTLNFDVALSPGDGENGVEIIFSQKAGNLLKPCYAARLKQIGEIGGAPVSNLWLAKDEMPESCRVVALSAPLRPLNEMARYGAELRRMRALLAQLFEELDVILAENRSPYMEEADLMTAVHSV
ncbi:hypothetical protein EBB79_21875 (plasmid) [Parasedimentitalea marina]|uniref:Glycosyltransferase family 1 protein n=2 Tax=Parasedimentitalea marina TaxID=2483033 RepID=A0A3T0N9E6_9RHOB|nr:hypothetical protein [Parasedimentitalea marina]AZV80619.1 hypothetical protein EBB79_21875 [Parasedimentitalea marina]